VLQKKGGINGFNFIGVGYGMDQGQRLKEIEIN
jgi:hypothetical protein